MIGGALPGAAQDTVEQGLLPIRNFGPSAYHGSPKTQALAQDSSGLLYLAHNRGLSIYDGRAWQILPTPRKVLAVHEAQDGTIYVAGEELLGRVAWEATGRPFLISLTDSLAPERARMGRLQDLESTSDALFIMDSQGVIRWQEGRFQYWPSAHTLSHLLQLQDTIYVFTADYQVFMLTEDGFQPAPGIPDVPVFGGIINPVAELLELATWDGALRYDGRTTTLLPTTPLDFLRTHGFSKAVILPGQRYAVATYGGGLLLQNAQTQLLRLVDQGDGLRNEMIWNVAADRDGNAWLALDNGISRVPFDSPVSFFDERNGLSGHVRDVVRHQGHLYVTTSLGLFRLIPGTAGRTAAFEQVLIDVHHLLQYGDLLLTSGSDGLFAVEETTTARLLEQHVDGVRPAQGDSTLLYVASINGFQALRFDPATEQFQAVDTPWRGLASYELAETSEGVLWTREGPARLFRFSPFDAPSAPPRIHTLDESGAQLSNLYHLRDRAIAITSAGVLRLPSAGPLTLRPDPDFAGYPGEIHNLHQDPSGTIWAGGTAGIRRARPDGTGRLHWAAEQLDYFPFRTNPDARLVRLEVSAEADTILWVATLDQLIRFRLNAPVPTAADYPTLIRTVTVADSVQVMGARQRAEPLRLPFSENRLRFTYSATSYLEEEHTRFQTQLVGQEAGWSAWTAETQRDYTNLPEGTYLFRVRARNAYSQLSEAATFAFIVEPPWYRTAGALLAFALLTLGLVYGGVWWRSARLQQRAERLEREVQARTAEIAKQKTQIEEQATQLVALDAAKSRFFANISHEFRTPLTLILGPIEQALHTQGDGAAGEAVTVGRGVLGQVQRNGRRLLRLVNQLLDLSKLEVGALPFHPERQDLVAFARRCTEVFGYVADYRNIDLRFNAPTTPVLLNFDAEHLEKVFANLVSNALKFTEPGGHVTVAVEPTSETVTLTVADTGEGIAAEKLPYIFDRFYQADSSSTRRYEGTGIGLAYTQELVRLHGGTIAATSAPGEGTRLTVTLPRLGQQLPQPSPVTLPPTGSPSGDGTATAAPPTLAAKARGVDAAEIRAAEEDVTTVLVVEDNAEMRAYLCSLFADGYHLREAADGAAGLQSARHHLPDLIISDVMMPHMDGFQLNEALKQNTDTASIPVILLTARAAEPDRLQGLATGADAYIEKPFSASILQAQVENLLAQRRRLRQHFANPPATPQPETPAPSPPPLSPFAQEVQTLIEHRYPDPEFSIEEMAATLAMSRMTLYRKIKTDLGQTPTELIRAVRLRHAKAALEAGTGTISEVAYGVGFNSLSYFGKLFRETYGAAPSAFVGVRS